jgi:choline dehydrogenase-like flavoprotein
MIIDLAQNNAAAALDTDVLIIGGGIAGLLLATRLRNNRIRVTLFESGGREQRDEVHPLNRVVLLADKYKGATHGRFRCLGGTSTRWGGALIPFLEQDLSARPYLGLPAWPITLQALRPYLTDLEKLFGVDPGSYEEDFVRQINANKFVPTGDPDFKARFAKWPIFKRRNVATLFKTQIENDPDLIIWINATAATFELDNTTGRLHSVTARHQNSNAVTVAATDVVICAGAIESTRLLLLLDRQYDERVFANSNALGNFFHDHISAPLAKINARRITRLNRLAGFRFVDKTMRSLRFELSPSTQASEGVPSAFGHIAFCAEKVTGFDALRDFLRALQQNGEIQNSLALRIFHDLPYLAKAGFWRYFQKQLYWPAPARYELHIVSEQLPRFENKITLASETDFFGLPLAAIKWRIEQSDCRAFTTYLQRFENFWKRHGLLAIGDLEPFVRPEAVSVEDISHGGDIYHPGGSTRIGTDQRSAVVDQNLRTFVISNLFIVSTSIFPSGASANPTLMLMLFTMRLADQLVKQYSNRTN